jgi:NADPH:quinone reductase-like Zn-dependent oxidoreductase
LVADGQVKPVVGRVVPMRDAAEAHRLMAAGEVVGKVLLRT